MFLSIDGIDGCGKTTHVSQLENWLQGQGYRVSTCRDPGGTPVGEAIRAVLLDTKTQIGRRSEMLLYMAARAQLVDQFIKPALKRGDIVLSDRFLLANIVYQGHAGGLNRDSLWEIGRFAVDGIEPDLTFVLDISPAAALARISRKLDRMERQGGDFRSKLQQGYLDEALRNPDRIKLINADRPVEEIQMELRQMTLACLGAPS